MAAVGCLAATCSLCSDSSQLAEVVQAPTSGCGSVHAKSRYTMMFPVLTCKLLTGTLEVWTYTMRRREVATVDYLIMHRVGTPISVCIIEH